MGGDTGDQIIACIAAKRTTVQARLQLHWVMSYWLHVAEALG